MKGLAGGYRWYVDGWPHCTSTREYLARARTTPNSRYYTTTIIVRGEGILKFLPYQSFRNLGVVDP